MNPDDVATDPHPPADPGVAPTADAIASVLDEAAARRARGEPFALVSVVRAVAPTSARPGDKAVVTTEGIVRGWIGGGCAQPAVLRTVREALADGRARLIRIAPTDRTEVRDVAEALGEVLEFGMSCHSGGTLELFVDPVVPAARLVVVGDAPVAQALAKLAPQVGFEVRAESACETNEAAVAQGRDWAGPAFVVVATQGRRDLPALRAALAARAQRVWFVASARKAEVLRAALVAGGADPAAVAAIVAPAGQPIGAVTPEEIALSVLAAVVAARRGRSTQAGAATTGMLAAAAAVTEAPVTTTPPSATPGGVSRHPTPLPRVAGDPETVRERMRERLARARAGHAAGAADAAAVDTTPSAPGRPGAGSCCGS
ncbi:MAG: XdhC family protein [Ideonella sp.]|jgi:xanthine dehydrogenase accessory factor|nr:XdhC family protein [Ideonella sp.]